MFDRIDWMTLSQLPGIGPVSFWSLVRATGDPATCLTMPSSEIEKILGIGKKQLDAFQHRQRIRESCLKQLNQLQEMGASCICFIEDAYPKLLKEIADPPPVLYVLGNSAALQQPAVAIVGSRASTTYGDRTAFSLARKLAEAGVGVISGLALGIDTEAHRGALAGEGSTVAVLGCGLDTVYPPQNSDLHLAIQQNGAIVTEYALGILPEPFRFPARNRLISGMSSGVIVVEAARKSGSLITAQLALDEGREVYAVPGRVDSYKSEGTHWLLKQGAKLVQDKDDILEDLRRISGPTVKLEAENRTDLEPQAQALLNILEVYPQSRESILQKSALTAGQLSEFLLLLELEGLVEILPGDEVCRRM